METNGTAILKIGDVTFKIDLIVWKLRKVYVG